MKKIALMTLAIVAASAVMTGCGKEEEENNGISFSAYITDKDGNIISEDSLSSSESLSESSGDTAENETAEDNSNGWDISVKYKDFLDYTFDGSYVLTPRGTEEYEDWKRGPCGSTVWKVTYPNYIGELSSREYRSFEFTEKDAENFADEKAMSDNDMFTFITGLIADKAEAEFAENILSKYYDGEFDYESGYWHGKDVSVLLMVYSPLTDKDTENKIISKYVSPDGGYKYNDMDLKKVAESPDFSFAFDILIDEDIDTAEYVETVRKIEADFIEYTGAPLSYSFGVHVTYRGENGIVDEFPMLDEYVLGEKFTESEDDKYVWGIWRYYEEKYGIKIF